MAINGKIRIYADVPGTDPVYELIPESITVDRGRNRELDPPRAGTCEFVLRNDTGYWNPGNTGETVTPFSGVGDVSPPVDLLAPGTAVQAFAGANLVTVFSGRIRSVDYDYRLDGTSTVRVTAEDSLANLARLALYGFSHAQQGAGLTVANVLSHVSYDSTISVAEVVWGTFEPAWAGSTQVIAQSAADLDGRNVLDYIADLERSEQGRVFVARDGMFVMFGRYVQPVWSGSLNDPIEFTDDPSSPTSGYTPIEYRGLRGSGGGDVLYTQIVGKSPSTGNVFQVVAAGAATYGVSDLRVGDLLNANDDNVIGVLTLLSVLYDSPEWRVDRVEVQPKRAASAADEADLLALDLHQTCRVKFTPPAGAAVDDEYLVQRITHRITPADHVMTMGLSVKAIDPDDLFVLDSSALDGPKILGY